MTKKYSDFDERILVIKLNDKPSSLEEIKKRASGAWKINADTIVKKGIEHVIVLYQQEVIADFSIGDQIGYYLTGKDAGRVWMHLENYKGFHKLQGSVIDYRTANPATTKLFSKLNWIKKIYVRPEDIQYDGNDTNSIVTVDGVDYEISAYEDIDNQYGDMYVEIFVNGEQIETINGAYNNISEGENPDSKINETLSEQIAVIVNKYFETQDED